jgi:hypothetical protein
MPRAPKAPKKPDILARERRVKRLVEDIMAAIDPLDELGGPESLGEYVEVLAEVQIRIARRISNAAEQISE